MSFARFDEADARALADRHLADVADLHLRARALVGRQRLADGDAPFADQHAGADARRADQH